jgi:hypothetical protein
MAMAAIADCPSPLSISHPHYPLPISIADFPISLPLPIADSPIADKRDRPC